MPAQYVTLLKTSLIYATLRYMCMLLITNFCLCIDATGASEVHDIGATAAYQTTTDKRGITLYNLYEL